MLRGLCERVVRKRNSDLLVVTECFQRGLFLGAHGGNPAQSHHDRDRADYMSHRITPICLKRWLSVTFLIPLSVLLDGASMRLRATGSAG